MTDDLGGPAISGTGFCVGARGTAGAEEGYLRYGSGLFDCVWSGSEFVC